MPLGRAVLAGAAAVGRKYWHARGSGSIIPRAPAIQGISGHRPPCNYAWLVRESSMTSWGKYFVPAALAVAAAGAHVQAATVWSESVQGDLSGNRTAPSV